MGTPKKKKNPSSTINRRFLFHARIHTFPWLSLTFFFLLNPFQHIIFYIKKKLYAKFIDPHTYVDIQYLSFTHTHAHIYMRVCVSPPCMWHKKLIRHNVPRLTVDNADTTFSRTIRHRPRITTCDISAATIFKIHRGRPRITPS